MNHELRAIILMLGAVRLELRAASFIANGAPAYELEDAWNAADRLSEAAGEMLEDANEQEAKTDG